MRTRHTPAEVDGALVIDKPPGLTSHDVVAAVRRGLGTPRAGHTGTLDPMATGVLAVLVGRATRLARFLAASVKAYEARVRLGWATDTYDATGQPVTPPREVTVSAAQVERALEAFRGTILQEPPAYSAKKVQGTRAYELARGQRAPVLAPVAVTVHSLELVSVNEQDVDLRLTCSAGFYVRSLAHDLGRALGVGGHLAGLRRTASGAFDIARAVPLDAVLGDAAEARAHVMPMADVLGDWPALRLSDEGLRRVRHGQGARPADVSGRAAPDAARVRLLAPDGSLAAIGERDAASGLLRPAVVLV
jgi:tRNA pseudouridine55 synthase